MGGISFYIHSFFLNRYLRNQNIFLTSLMLPAVALVITKAIASNFFLSLGLIGALSIIRYRTPVKSMYELAMLFFLVTLGVVGGVNLKWAVGLFCFISLIAPIVSLLKRIVPNVFVNYSNKKTGSNLIVNLVDNTSTQGNLLINEEVVSLLESKGELISIDSKVISKETEIQIHLTFPDLKSVFEAEKLIKNSKKIKSISIN